MRAVAVYGRFMIYPRPSRFKQAALPAQAVSGRRSWGGEIKALTTASARDLFLYFPDRALCGVGVTKSGQLDDQARRWRCYRVGHWPSDHGLRLLGRSPFTSAAWCK